MLGQQVKFFREKAGLTQSELADLVGVSLHAVRQWESGRRQPSVAMLAQVGQTLGVTIDQLLMFNMSKKCVPSGAKPVSNGLNLNHHYTRGKIDALRAEVGLLRLAVNDLVLLMRAKPRRK